MSDVNEECETIDLDDIHPENYRFEWDPDECTAEEWALRVALANELKMDAWDFEVDEDTFPDRAFGITGTDIRIASWDVARVLFGPDPGSARYEVIEDLIRNAIVLSLRRRPVL